MADGMKIEIIGYKIKYYGQFNCERNLEYGKRKIKAGLWRLTDDDLKYEEGKDDELLGRLQQKTGKTKDDLRKWFKSNIVSSSEKSRI